MTVPDHVVIPVAKQILETMYFCNPEYVGAGALASPQVAACVVFRGRFSGVINVVATECLAARFASDLLAIDEKDLTSLQIACTVTELANVFCGAALSAWMPGEDFNFSIPSQMTPEAHRTFSHCFAVDGPVPELAIEVHLSD